MWAWHQRSPLLFDFIFKLFSSAREYLYVDGSTVFEVGTWYQVCTLSSKCEYSSCPDYSARIYVSNTNWFGINEINWFILVSKLYLWMWWVKRFWTHWSMLQIAIFPQRKEKLEKQWKIGKKGVWSICSNHSMIYPFLVTLTTLQNTI